jgi:hypothetical protein
MCDDPVCDDGDLHAHDLPDVPSLTATEQNAAGAGPPWWSRLHSRRRVLQGALVTAGAVVASPYLDLLSPRSAYAATGWRFYRTDPHVHCVVSGDAVSDPGVLAAAATVSGKNAYDVIFLTDHHLGSNFSVAGQSAVSGSWTGTLNAGTSGVQDSTSKWSAAKYGTLTTYVAAKSTTQVHTVSPALQLKAQAGSSGSYGEAMAWYKRGPNLLSSNPVITFWVYPTQIDPGCSVYVSASLGGDPTTPYRADGYTTKADHIPRLGKSHVFVWQLGAATVPLGYPANTTVHRYPLGAFVLNRWNAFTINVGNYLTAVTGGSDAPVDLNALVHLKMAVASVNNGLVEAYFDDWKHTATPLPTPQEFSARNTDIPYYNTSAFKILPSIELGLHEHVQRFNFADASQWKDYPSGVGLGTSPNGIADVQATGYPAQLNHPGLPGGPTQQGTIDNNAYGADIMEACARGSDLVMITIWDAILSKGIPLVGSWSSDAHRTATLNPCTYIQARSTSFDDLMHSFFEGRAFMANRSFPGQVALNLSSGDPDSYPARYPVYVPGGSATATAHVAISAGVATSSTVRWIINGAVASSDVTNGPAYERSYAVPLAASGPTYARAELLDGAGNRVAMTQAIFFFAVAGLPVGTQFHISQVSSTGGPIFTKAVTKGITAASFSSGTLALSLGNSAGALAEIAMTTQTAPVSITVDGSTVPKSSSLADYQTAAGTAWYSSGTSVWLKALHNSDFAAVRIMFPGATGDMTPPTVPSGLTASQDSSGVVQLSWAAATDNVGIAGYTVYRNGPVLGTTGASTLAYSDNTVAPNTPYSYTVDAFDAAGNHSAKSAAASLTTRGDTSGTFTAVADAYVVAGDTVNHGTATSLKTDTSPATTSYLKFTLSGLTGTITTATLKVYATSSLTAGFSVRAVTDTSWTETAIVASNAPPYAAAGPNSGPVTAGNWISVPVTGQVKTTSGTISLALVGLSSTNLSLASREATNKPQLVITTG